MVEHCNMGKWPNVSSAIEAHSKRNYLIHMQKLFHAKKCYVPYANTGQHMPFKYSHPLAASQQSP
jgi:hypothetical protein